MIKIAGLIWLTETDDSEKLSVLSLRHSLAVFAVSANGVAQLITIFALL